MEYYLWAILVIGCIFRYKPRSQKNLDKKSIETADIWMFAGEISVFSVFPAFKSRARYVSNK